MIALLHAPNMFESPDAVAWVQDGLLKWHADESARQSSVARGRRTLRQIEVRRQGPWVEVFRLLDERNPDPAVWAVVETPDPVAYLRGLRRARA